MRIILSSIMPDLAAAFRKHCGELEDVEILEGDILELEVDAVVSPANSFGFMDGGIDMAYSRHFGWHVEQRLQRIIESKYRGELLVGQAQIVPTLNERIPYVIAAPTMRTPSVLPKNTVNPFLAARAVLQHIQFDFGPFFTTKAIEHCAEGEDPLKDYNGDNNHDPIRNKVRSVAFPGLGTGIGQVPADLCAHQMKKAIEYVRAGDVPFPHSLGNAVERQRGLLPNE